MLSNKRRIVFLILLIFWMSLIFWFSSRTGTVSTGDSDTAGSAVLKIFIRDYDSLPTAEKVQRLETLTYPIRKISHCGEYFILGILFMGFLSTFFKKMKNAVIWAWILAAAYAVTDEIHQLFVTGRSGQALDVLIDSAGAIAGILIVYAIIVKLRKR